MTRGDILEAWHGRHEQALQSLQEQAPDLVCFTLMSLNVRSCIDFTAQLRRRLPEAVIACGGPAATYTVDGLATIAVTGWCRFSAGASEFTPSMLT